MVRIATHPDAQRMGYGTRAMKLLMEYYSGKMCSSIEDSAGAIPDVLLIDLCDRCPEALDYVGVCFGITAGLLRYSVMYTCIN